MKTFLEVLLTVGFWGSMCHPVFIIPLLIGAVGTYKIEQRYGTEGK